MKMNKQRIRELIGFYQNELTNNILFFWLPKCIDKVNGGFFNCYSNDGKQLYSRDKYTWSQGRFVWIFSKLAMMDCGIFTSDQRENFLSIAKNGLDFLKKNCLIAPQDWRCVFLMDEKGNHKYVNDYKQLDMSIYADCFVVLAFSKYAEAAEDKESYIFSRMLYESCIKRIKTNEYNTLPYPLSKKYRAHGIPMILSNITIELHGAAKKFDSSYCEVLQKNLHGFCEDILTNFVDENHVIHEVITCDNHFVDNILGQYANPGHTLECMWFMIEACDILKKPQYIPVISSIVNKAFKIGWDDEFEGLLHFCSVNGGKPVGKINGAENEPMYKLLENCWSDKLWWVHSEALYTSLLCYYKTNDEKFVDLYNKVFCYALEHFPNSDREVREWVQILSREGKPTEKVVALPVKDPYHIIRNLVLIIELLNDIIKKI